MGGIISEANNCFAGLTLLRCQYRHMCQAPPVIKIVAWAPVWVYSVRHFFSLLKKKWIFHVLTWHGRRKILTSALGFFSLCFRRTCSSVQQDLCKAFVSVHHNFFQINCFPWVWIPPARPRQKNCQIDRICKQHLAVVVIMTGREKEVRRRTIKWKFC